MKSSNEISSSIQSGDAIVMARELCISDLPFNDRFVITIEREGRKIKEWTIGHDSFPDLGALRTVIELVTNLNLRPLEGSCGGRFVCEVQ